ncbi:MAG: hypothetical protein WBG30_07530 [Psychrilyobacter sp.]|uniref:hypothetical protein n=1 Tax=Psychrilyobacter sp. TaxID=2586924 RepID=UPI003C7817F7
MNDTAFKIAGLIIGIVGLIGGKKILKKFIGRDDNSIKDSKINKQTNKNFTLFQRDNHQSNIGEK